MSVSYPTNFYWLFGRGIGVHFPGANVPLLWTVRAATIPL